MPSGRSANFKAKTSSLAAEDPLYLLEITHPQLAVPIRVVNDNQDLVSGGNNFIAFGFSVTLPDDIERQLPRARLTIDNTGRELVQWLEASSGGRGAKVRVMQVMRGDPNVIEADYLLDLLNVRQNGAAVSAELGYEDTLNQAALPMTYRPDNTPGMF